MKKITFASLLITLSIASFAQSEKYIAVMKKNITAIDSGFKNPTYLVTVANNFERIAQTEKTQWLPFYYAAFCQVNSGFMEKDKNKIDAIADKATELINKADSLHPNNSEISCIKSMIASCHMMVDPMQRWRQYGAIAGGNIKLAMQQDSTNPRPNYLTGQGLKYTPEQFGGGCKTAKKELQIAADKFSKFKPATDLDPNWGKEINEKLLSDCNK